MNEDLSLSLQPFSVDGRQLQSNPCKANNKATYQRYNQSETFKVLLLALGNPFVIAKALQKWQVYIDPYTKLKRLDLYMFDGAPMNPMFQAFNPPQMLPTSTLNPTSTAAPTGKSKRGEEEQYAVPLNQNAAHIVRRDSTQPLIERIDLNMVWWAGVGMTILGGAAYLM